MESVEIPTITKEVRFSNRKHRRANRQYSATQLTTVDQKWGILFQNNAAPTPRLGQFLRGLANCINQDFPPKKSTVVTTAKMQKYYEQYPVTKEPHPLREIFGALSNELISRLYQDLECQHHLVQEDLGGPPVIPALTPVGFARWITVYILAYPEEESERLQKVVLALPVNADGEVIDGKPERLPKQLSRYLFPQQRDHKYKIRLDNAITNILRLDEVDRRKCGNFTVEINQARTTAAPSKARRENSSLPSRQKPTTRTRAPDVTNPRYYSCESSASQKNMDTLRPGAVEPRSHGKEGPARPTGNLHRPSHAERRDLYESLGVKVVRGIHRLRVRK